MSAEMVSPRFASRAGPTLGHLVFGHVFSWSNFPAYAVGILAAFAIEAALRRIKPHVT